MQLFWKRSTYFGGRSLRWTYALIALQVSSAILPNLAELLSYCVIAENTEEKVELMVAVRASTVEFPSFAESKAASIEDSSLQVDLGTQSVFPLFAMICSSTFVITDCRFLLFSLA